MSGTLWSAAVVLSQNTPLWGCSYMQRHLSGQQRGRTGLWTLSCHLWPGSWPWSSLWYTERPGEQQMKVKLIKRRGRRAAQGFPHRTHMCTNRNAKVKPERISFQRRRLKTSWWMFCWWFFWRLLPGDLLCHLSAQPFVRLPPRSSSYRLADSQASSRKGIPSTVRAAVFVLPNSILIHSSSSSQHPVYVGALLHRGAWRSWKTKTSPWLPIWWHDRWKLLQLSGEKRKDKRGQSFLSHFPLLMIRSITAQPLLSHNYSTIWSFVWDVPVMALNQTSNNLHNTSE